MLVGRFSREHLQVSSPASRVWRLERQVAGYTLALSGTLADLVAGWSILDRPGAWCIFIHIPAVLTWTLGLYVLRRSGVPLSDTSSGQAISDPHDAGWLVRWWNDRVTSVLYRPELVALLLALLLFPGLIPLGWCLGFGLAHAQRTPRHTGFRFVLEESMPGEAPSDQPVTDLPLHSLTQTGDQTRHAENMSPADAARDPSVEVRRGAIAILGQLGTPEAVSMLRRLLTDSHADVRLDASITLARLEATFSRAVSEAAKLRSRSSSAISAYASQCFDYACSGLLDPVSSRFYLTEAREALRICLTHHPESAETWTMLARIHANLGEMTEATHAIDQAISLPDPSTDAFLLGMEIAFHEHEWEKLIGLASHMHQEPLEIDERWRIARWWAAIPAEGRNKRQLGTKRSTTAGTLRKSRGNR